MSTFRKKCLYIGKFIIFPNIRKNIFLYIDILCCWIARFGFPSVPNCIWDGTNVLKLCFYYFIDVLHSFTSSLVIEAKLLPGCFRPRYNLGRRSNFGVHPLCGCLAAKPSNTVRQLLRASLAGIDTVNALQI